MLGRHELSTGLVPMSSLSEPTTAAFEQDTAAHRRLPSERELRETTWMSWPQTADKSRSFDDACRAVATTAVKYGPVSLLLEPGQRFSRLGKVETVSGSALGGTCLGDGGPSFILGEQGVQGIEWTRPEQSAVPKPRRKRGPGPPLGDVPVVRSPLDLGAIDTDGWGTALVAADTLDRNPGWTHDQVADELAKTVGITQVVWLPHLLGNPEEGHGFAPALFASPGLVLVHDQENIGHPDNEATIETVARLSRCYDSVGRPLQFVRVPAPARLHEDDQWLHWTYLGYGLVDGAVLLPTFDDPHDQVAAEIFGAVFPDREIVTVDARPLFRAGHTIGCLLRGQPEPR